MCLPAVFIALGATAEAASTMAAVSTAVIAMGSTAASIAANNAATSRQNALIDKQQEASKNAMLADQEALKSLGEEQAAKNNLENLERQRQGLRERAKLNVAFGNASIDGLSPMREMSNSLLQENFDTGVNDTNFENQAAQIARESGKVNANFTSRYLDAEASRRSPQNWAISGLQIAGAGLSAYSNSASHFKVK